MILVRSCHGLRTLAPWYKSKFSIQLVNICSYHSQLTKPKSLREKTYAMTISVNYNDLYYPCKISQKTLSSNPSNGVGLIMFFCIEILSSIIILHIDHQEWWHGYMASSLRSNGLPQSRARLILVEFLASTSYGYSSMPHQKRAIFAVRASCYNSQYKLN